MASNLEEEVKKLKEELKNKDEQIEGIRETLIQTYQELEKFQNSNLPLKQNDVESQQIIEKQKKEIENLKQEIKQLKIHEQLYLEKVSEANDLQFKIKQMEEQNNQNKEINIQDHQSQNQQQVQVHQQKIMKLEEQLIQFQQKVKDDQQEIKNLNDQLNALKNNLQQSESKAYNQQQVNELIQKLKIQEEEKNRLNGIVQDLQLKFKQTDENKKLSSSDQNMNNLIMQNKQLEQQMISMQEKIGHNVKPNVENMVNEEKYDMVVYISKSTQFKDGIPFSYHLNDNKYFKSQEELAKRANFDSILVSITGFANRGKSFMCNQLSARNVSTGFSKRTEGFGLIYSNQEQILVNYLDTQGFGDGLHFFKNLNVVNKVITQKKQNNESTNIFQSISSKTYDPLSKEYQEATQLLANITNNQHIYYLEESQLQNLSIEQLEYLWFVVRDQCEKKKEYMLTERTLMEKLIQDFVMEMTPIAIFVVGRMTLEEQRLIAYISTNYPQKTLFILHNFMELRTVDEVLNTYYDDLQYCFNTQPLIKLDVEKFEEYKSFKDNFLVFKDKNNSNIKHLVIAQEFSPAGNILNKQSMDFIRAQIKSETKAQPINLFNAISQYLNNHIYNFVFLKDQQGTLQKPKLDYTPLQEKGIIFSSEVQKHSLFLHQRYFDPLGKLVKMPSENEIVLYYSRYWLESQNKIVYVFEASGNFEKLTCQVIVSQLIINRPQYKLLIRGIKKKNQLILQYEAESDLNNNIFQIAYGNIQQAFEICDYNKYQIATGQLEIQDLENGQKYVEIQILERY